MNDKNTRISGKLPIGKLPNDKLNSMIINKLNHNRSEIMIRPAMGEDCSIFDPSGFLCAVTSDPVTAAENNAGRIAINVSCNDLAACGAKPLGIMVVILVPQMFPEDELKNIINQMISSAALLGIDIMGGHTEVSDAVIRPVIVGTGIGLVQKEKLISTGGARPGDYLIATKYAAMEGTAIIASDHFEELKNFLCPDELEYAKSLSDYISVVEEGLLAAENGATAMHDATEGGILGAIWEMCEASGTGIDVDGVKIPVLDVTRAICNYYDINPLKLISSGCMLIAHPDGKSLVKALEDFGHRATVIGRFSKDEAKLIHIGGRHENIFLPDSDELYKIKSKKITL